MDNLNISNHSRLAVNASQLRSTSVNTSDGPTDVYERAQGLWLQTQLNNRAASNPSAFRESLELAMGPRADGQAVNALIDAAVEGSLPMPQLRFVDAGSLGAGALGAYDPRGGGTILLDRSLLADPVAMERVFTEEAGHHFDALLGAGDAAGDEGELFARSMLGEDLSAADISALRTENDHGRVMLDGRLTVVEFSLGSDTPGGSPEGIGGDDSNVGGGSTGGSDNDHDNDHDPVTTRPTAPVVPQTPLLGPVSLPPQEISGTGPIDELNAELQGNSLDTLPGPVGTGNNNLNGNLGTDEDGATGTGSADVATIGVLGGWLLTGGRVVSTAVLGTIGALLSLLTLSGSSATPPGAMNNVAKGPRLDPESEEAVNEAVGETTRENVTSNGTIIDSVPDGDAEQANEDFDEMGLRNVTTNTGTRGEVRTGNLPDGSRVTVRPSADGRQTIDITELDQNDDAVRGRVREIRYGSN